MQKLNTIFNIDTDGILGQYYGKRYREYRAKWNRVESEFWKPSFPLHIDLESTGKCNLKCKMCNRQLITTYKQNRGLSRELIKRVIDEGSENDCYSLEYGNDDETLIEPQKFLDTAQYALDKGYVDIWLSTNGILMTEELSLNIIKMKLPRLTISLDAVQPETYQLIRGKDKYDSIISNIDIFNRLKKEMGSPLPILRVTFVVMEQNWKEQQRFVEYWRNRSDIIMFQSLIDLTKTFNEMTDESKTTFLTSTQYCFQPFRRVSINGDGTVNPCCCIINDKMDLGNIKTKTIKDMWNSRQLENLRNNMRQNKWAEIDVCKKCFLATQNS